MTGRLAGKIALVTGAALRKGSAPNIGYATAAKLVREGVAGLTIVDMRDEDLAHAQQELTKLSNGAAKILTVKADVSNETDVVNYYAAHRKAFNDELDINVQNAGVMSPMQSWTDTPVEAYDKQFAVNSKGVWLGVKHGTAVMLLKEPKPNVLGSDLPRTKALALISSVAALYGEAGVSAYVGSKWSVRGMSLSAAAEFGPKGIRCNSIHPGPVDTPLLRAGFSDDTIEQIKASIPVKRMGSPDELANVVAFACSDEASYLNGAYIPVHGGQVQG